MLIPMLGSEKILISSISADIISILDQLIVVSTSFIPHISDIGLNVNSRVIILRSFCPANSQNPKVFIPP